MEPSRELSGRLTAGSIAIKAYRDLVESPRGRGPVLPAEEAKAPMLAFQAFDLVHRHTDGEWAPLREVDPHDAAGLDAERDWLPGARMLRCAGCGEEVAVLPHGAEASHRRGSPE